MSYRLNFFLSPASVLITTAGFRFFSDLGGGEKGLPQVLPELRRLLLFVAVSLPTSLAIFRLALRRAKRDGSLIQY